MTSFNLIQFPIDLGLFAHSFEEKIKTGLLLGSASEQMTPIVQGELKRVRTVAKTLYLSMSPTKPEAIDETKRAAAHFFSLADRQLVQSGAKYPLAGKNKCLGMAVVPNTKLVLMAISQDKSPENDIELRQNMMKLIASVNNISKKWVFELVRVPTQSEYLILRTLSMRTPHQAPKEWIEPQSRCVEVGLMVALCKAGRFKRFNPEDIGVVAMGGTLWDSPKGNIPVAAFGGKFERNFKYVSTESINVELEGDKIGWIDVWDPCSQHCAIYKNAMLAVSAAGGPATCFTEPRAEYTY